MRNHVLIDKESMPKTRVMEPTKLDVTEDFCEFHPDKPLEFYCNDHKYVACYICVTLVHKQCKVDFIPDVSGNVTDEMNDVLEQIESLVRNCKSNIKYTGKALQNLDQSYAEVVEDIKFFREEINECLDKMETKILQEAKTFVQAAKCKQETVQTANLEITEELECLQSLLRTLREENKQNKFFIEMIKASKRLPIMRDKEKQVLQANKTDDCLQFTRNTCFIHELKTRNEYGHLSTQVKPSPARATNLAFSRTINVNSKFDRTECNITGIVKIAPERMILVDNINNNIILLDTEKDVVVTEIKMSSLPCDVISLPANKLAVSLINEMCIQILSYTGTELSFGQRIGVKGRCNGIAYCSDKFVVAFWKARKILIFNLSGEVINVIDSPALFHGPSRVIISNDERFLYISDTDWSQNNKVVKMDWEGNLMNEFKEPGHASPFGIQQLEDETILVCYKDSKNILRLSGSLNKCEIVGLDEIRLKNPKALTYCDKEQQLYVSCSAGTGKWYADIVKVFNVKWI
jgi:hypothetical protein